MGKVSKVSPFAPASLPAVPPIAGVRFATAEAGIRYKGRTDLLMAVLDPGSVAAGVTTRSKTCSAPVLWCRRALKGGKARADSLSPEERSKIAHAAASARLPPSAHRPWRRG